MTAADGNALAALARELREGMGDGVECRVPFAELSTYRLGGPVAVLARVRSESALVGLAAVVRRHRPPVLVAGRGSNLLVADAGFPGLVVVLAGEYEALDVADGPQGRVRAGGGVALPVLARRSAAAGLAGLEFYVGIPGSVGGAVRMNAGGHGRETKDVLHRAWLIDLLAEEDPPPRREVAAAQLDLGYRQSNLGPAQVVVGAEFGVSRDAPGDCEARVAGVVRWRRDHQPGGANAGSVFRNPPGDAAGRLIEASGLKGLRVGGAVVSEKHANFFQAAPGATASDVRALVLEVQRRVADATGVRLVPELRMVGEFDD